MAERNLILNASAVLWRRSALLAALARCEPDLQQFQLAGDWRLYAEILARLVPRSLMSRVPLNRHRRHPQSVTARLSQAGAYRRDRAHARCDGGAPWSRFGDLRQRQRRYRRSVGGKRVHAAAIVDSPKIEPPDVRVIGRMPTAQRPYAPAAAPWRRVAAPTVSCAAGEKLQAAFAVAIKRITQNRTAEMGAMHADLMGPAGPWPQFQACESGSLSGMTVCRTRHAVVAGAPAGSTAMDHPYGRLCLASGALMTPLSPGGRPRTTAQIDLRHLPGCKRRLRRMQRRPAQRDDQTARGIPIEPMRQPRPVAPAR